jgi:hypothetical protein
LFILRNQLKKNIKSNISNWCLHSVLFFRVNFKIPSWIFWMFIFQIYTFLVFMIVITVFTFNFLIYYNTDIKFVVSETYGLILPVFHVSCLLYNFMSIQVYTNLNLYWMLVSFSFFSIGNTHISNNDTVINVFTFNFLIYYTDIKF